jgi:hypothetical protein
MDRSLHGGEGEISEAESIMIRSTSPEKLNFLINHSDVRDALRDDNAPDYLDAGRLLADPDTHFLLFEGGGLIFWRRCYSVWEGDIYFLARKRGLPARQAAIESLNYMFAFAEAIRVKVPAFNAPSRHFVTGLGFKRIHIEPASRVVDGVKHDVVVYELGKQEWAAL